MVRSDPLQNNSDQFSSGELKQYTQIASMSQFESFTDLDQDNWRPKTLNKDGYRNTDLLM